MFHLRKKKKSKLRVAAEFSADRITPEILCNYLAYLATKDIVEFIGYRFIDRGGEIKRVVLLIEDYNKPAWYYFKDRCPAIIEADAYVQGKAYQGGYTCIPTDGRGWFYVAPKKS